jgi:NitT/TauT family transport system permease protein
VTPGLPVVTVREVSKAYPSGTLALDRLSLDVEPGELLSLLGPSGCGKSTLLRLIAGLAEPSAGAIQWGDPAAQNRLGFVFQEPTLMPWARVEDNVRLPLMLAGTSRGESAGRVGDALAHVGLEGFERAYPRELSGGMRMRVSIARALVTQPRVLLMDEPFASLDEITRFRLESDLAELHQRRGLTVVFVTHSVFESVYLGSRVVVLSPRPGRVAASRRIEGPTPRVEAFRTSTAYLDACRDVSAFLAAAMERPLTLALSPPGARESAARTMRPRYRVLAPALVGLVSLGAWEGIVRWEGIPPYILPGPFLIAQTVVTDWGTLFPSLLVTLAITAAAFLVSAVLGLALAVLFTQSAWIERAFFPYAVVLQVTPLVAIAPLIILWVKWIPLALLVCAWLVAFFPVLANTVLGLTSTDRNLVDLFRLYGATRWQALRYLRLPAALPYFLGGLRISGGLALIGAVVAEFVAGTGGAQSGLAFRILEAGYQLQIPRMFSAVFLISAAGVLIFVLLTGLSRLALGRWHESEIETEG